MIKTPLLARMLRHKALYLISGHEDQIGVILLLLIFAALVGRSLYKSRKYKNTAYYRITKNPRRRLNKGMRGEYLIYTCLRHLEKDGGRFLFNLYLPTINGGTTEIDVLLISAKGLFVFESKNYGGWIFGHEADKNWTQIFPTGHKQQFYNPVMQNDRHVAHLKKFIDEDIPAWSIVVFSDHCTL